MHLLYILAFVLLGSAQDVFLGHIFAVESPIAVVFFCFGIAFLVLQIGFFINRPNSLAEIRRNWFGLCLLNLVTALNWICFFGALKYIQPAVVGAISFSIGPAFTNAFGSVFRPSMPRPSLRLWISSAGIILSSAFLSYGSAVGISAVKTTRSGEAIFGIFLALASGVGMTANTFISKFLSDSVLKSQTITAFRFVALVMVSGFFLLWSRDGNNSFSIGVVGSLIGVALFGVVLPMMLIQMGVKASEPRLVAGLLALTPAVTLLFEVFDSRLSFSPSSMIGVLLLCLCAVAGVK